MFRFHDLIVTRGRLDMSLREFYTRDDLEFLVFTPEFWLDVYNLGEDDWFEATEEFIHTVAHKHTDFRGAPDYYLRFLRCLWDNFEEDIDFLLHQPTLHHHCTIFVRRRIFMKLLVKINTSGGIEVYRFGTGVIQSISDYNQYKLEANMYRQMQETRERAGGEGT